MTFKHQYLSSLIIASMMMTACGSGESDKEDIKAVNQKPTVSVAPSSFQEKAMATIAATASDPDGEITGYSWTVVSDHDLTLQNADSDTVSFTSPEVGLDGDIIELALTVTDDAGETATTNVQITINPNTIPLSIKGLATDAPLSNATISVNISGRDVGVETTTDAKGNYTVDLLLDDSEADSVVKIVAHGSGEQSNAGLISWLGTVEKLSQQAGDDKTLTAADNFAVNVTNITTALYGLAMHVNNDEAIKDDTIFDQLSSQVNPDEVLTLATTIKVAIDKSTNNQNLELPDGINNTLELIDDIAIAKHYIQQVRTTQEYADAQQEMFNDGNLFDTVSEYATPRAYYVIPSTLASGNIYNFNPDGKGSIGDVDYEWNQENGTIIANVTHPEVFTSYDFVEINGVKTQVSVEYSTTKYELKRVSSNDTSDLLLITSYNNNHYPNGELEDKVIATSSVNLAAKESSVQPIRTDSLDTAYMPIPYEQVSESVLSFAEIIFLKSDNSGTLHFSDKQFTWQDDQGMFKLNFDDGTTTRFKKIQTGKALDLFALESSEDGINYRGYLVGEGKFVSEAGLPQWKPDQVAGIYGYDNSVFNNPLENYWFELHENGDADTISTSDLDENGVLSVNEIFISYGNWQILDDGTLRIQRFRSQNLDHTPTCRRSETPECILYHERNWKLIAQQGNQYGLLHTHHMILTDRDNYTYDTRTVYKVDNAPIDINQLISSNAIATKSTQSHYKVIKRYSHLEPSN
ncbi:PKD domain-containing protein [Shewanella sp. KCT]|uniref:PKD domain-containing protein n=1 Tax=Shewanella sp. KCT TaxID=2569535 RepID=UPI001182B972|nr:hypothetical protein [Shewanella sp. KCT]TVP16341.1 hypothetical protein AYI87_02685 [Shewanella sp. KCT]